MKPEPPWTCDLIVVTESKRSKCPNAAFILSPDGYRVCRRCKGLLVRAPERVVIPSVRLEEWKQGQKLRLYEVEPEGEEHH